MITELTVVAIERKGNGGGLHQHNELNKALSLLH